MDVRGVGFWMNCYLVVSNDGLFCFSYPLQKLIIIIVVVVVLLGILALIIGLSVGLK